jgi:general secretion pathway protein K
MRPARRARSALNNRESGFALLIVLWTMVLLALLAAQVTGGGRAETKLAAAMRISAQLQAAADGAVYESIWHLMDGDGDAWAPGNAVHVLAEPGAKVTVQIEDERGKIDINNAAPALIQGLFNVLGVDSTTATNVAQAINDWRQQGGAGDDSDATAAYRMDGRLWGPPAEDFERLDELLLVRGMTPKLYKMALPFLTLALEQSPWPQYAGPTVQAAVARARQDSALAADHADLRGPVVMQITATATGADGARFIRRTLMRLDGALNGPAWKYRILTWDAGPA